MYKVNFSRTAEKDLKKLDRLIQLIIMKWIKKNLVDCENPYLHGKALKAELKGYWRYRIGDYRLICNIGKKECMILVLNVGDRKKIYK